jgi:hypothetical protein
MAAFGGIPGSSAFAADGRLRRLTRTPLVAPGTILCLALGLGACAREASPLASPAGTGTAAAGGAASGAAPPVSADAAAGAATSAAAAQGTAAASPSTPPASTPPASSPNAEPTGRPAAPPLAAPAPSGGPTAPLPALPVVWAEARASDGASALQVEGITAVARDSTFEVAVGVRAPEARLQLLDARHAVVPSSGSTLVADETRFRLAPDEPLRPGAEYSLRLEGLRASGVASSDGRTFQPLALRVRVAGAAAPPPRSRGPKRPPDTGLAPAGP